MTAEQAAELAADNLPDDYDRPSTFNVGGWEFSLRIVPDDSGLNPFEEYDHLGRVELVRRGQTERPDSFNGAASKIHTDRDVYWWMPPADVIGDPIGLAAVRERAHGWLNDYWSYVGLEVSARGPVCPNCGQRPTYSAGLWGVESDDRSYLAQTFAELILEAIPND